MFFLILLGSIFLLILRCQVKKTIWPLLLLNIYSLWSGLIFFPNRYLTQGELEKLLKSNGVEKIIERISSYDWESMFFFLYFSLLLGVSFLWRMSGRQLECKEN